jgi:hypothetical protein
VCAQVGRVRSGQSAAAPADGRADCIDDERFGHAAPPWAPD